MEVLKNEEQQQKKVTFDPQKTYGWEKETKVEVSASLLETIRGALAKEFFPKSDEPSPVGVVEAQVKLTKYDIFIALTALLKENVENGTFHEVVKEEEATPVAVEEVK